MPFYKLKGSENGTKQHFSPEKSIGPESIGLESDSRLIENSDTFISDRFKNIPPLKVL